MPSGMKIVKVTLLTAVALAVIYRVPQARSLLTGQGDNFLSGLFS